MPPGYQYSKIIYKKFNKSYISKKKKLKEGVGARRQMHLRKLKKMCKKFYCRNTHDQVKTEMPRILNRKIYSE